MVTGTSFARAEKRSIMNVARFIAVAFTLAAPTACAFSAATRLDYSEPAKQTALQILEHVEALKSDPDNPNARGWWNQMTAAAGREDMLVRLENPDGQYDDPSGFICEAIQDGDAIDAILEIASDHSLVIINEHHAMPDHRIFIRELALRLKSQGYTHYAAETLTQKGADGVGFPLVQDGYYTAEPLMARLIADVRAAGFQLVAYEQTADQASSEGADIETQISDREKAQVSNLLAAVLSANPDTKMLIHVGHSHVAEKPVPGPSGTLWMAAILKEATGIDPLTLSLTGCRSGGDSPVLSNAARSRSGIARPMFTDYLVGLPIPVFENGRPTYRTQIGDWPVEVPGTLRPVSESVLVEARPLNASFEQKPSERLYLAPGEDLPLMLPAGEWSLVSVDGNGRVRGPVHVNVLGK